MTTKTYPQQQQQTASPAQSNDPDRALVILSDDNKAFKLDQDDWQADAYAFKLSPQNAGIIRQLDSFGSYLAVVQKNEGATTFINQRAILRGADVEPLPPREQTEKTGPTTTDAQTLTVLGDDGRVYVLSKEYWHQKDFELNPEKGTDEIAEKLAELGSYVAFVRKDVALQIGACCTVVNLRAILASQPNTNAAQ